jgi:hypothetical protein
LALAVFGAGCSEAEYTDVSVYLDAPEALEAVDGPGWEPMDFPANGTGLLPDPGLGPLPVAPEDLAVAGVTWVRDHWKGRSHIRWEEEVEYDASSHSLEVTARNDAGPDRLREDLLLFLADATALDAAASLALADQALAHQWATWPDEGNSPRHALVDAELPLDLLALAKSKGLGVEPVRGGYIDGPMIGSGRDEGWSIDLRVRSWRNADLATDQSYDNESAVVVNAAGQLAVGGTYHATYGRTEALEAVRPTLERAGLGTLSLADAKVELHQWGSW